MAENRGQPFAEYPQGVESTGALDEAGLRQAALAYVARYATTAARLQGYLERLVARRGWRVGAEGPSERACAAEAVARLIRLCIERGYVNDRAFAEARAAALLRRGLGRQRIDQSLFHLGIGREDREAVLEGVFALRTDEGMAIQFGDRAHLDPHFDPHFEGSDPEEASALAYARRRRFGPFARSIPDAAANRRAFGAMIRAGHPASIVKRILAQGAVLDVDDEGSQADTRCGDACEK